MAKASTILIKMESTADTGYYYVTKKNPRTQTEKLELRKYDPVIRKHVAFKEGKIKWPNPKFHRETLSAKPKVRYLDLGYTYIEFYKTVDWQAILSQELSKVFFIVNVLIFHTLFRLPFFSI